MARRELRSKLAMNGRENDQSSSDCAGECAGRAGGFPLMRDLGLAPVEVLTVNIFRCICDLYVSGSGEGWDVALNSAEKELGPIHGPECVARVTAFVRALRIERQGKFSYLGYGCQHICNDELALMTLIKSIRMKDERARKSILQDIIRIAHGANRTCQTADLIAEFHSAHLSSAVAQRDLGSSFALNNSAPGRASGWLH